MSNDKTNGGTNETTNRKVSLPKRFPGSRTLSTSIYYMLKKGMKSTAHCLKGVEYALIGATVSPGFEYEDFEMPSKEELRKKFPNAVEAIELLT